MKSTVVISIIACFVLLISVILIGCRRRTSSPYFMGSNEYNSLISGMESNRAPIKTETSSDFKDITPPPRPDNDGDSVDNSSRKPSSSTPAVSSSKPASSSSEPISSSSEPQSSSSKKPSGSIGTDWPDGAIGDIV